MKIDLSDVLDALSRAIDGMADAVTALEEQKDNIDDSLDDAQYEEAKTAIDDMIMHVSNMQSMIDGLKEGFKERFR